MGADFRCYMNSSYSVHELTGLLLGVGLEPFLA